MALIELFERLKNIGKKRTYQSGEMIFFEVEEANKLFILLSGSARLYKSHPTLATKEHTLHIINAPNFIAEMPFFIGVCYPASAVCNECSEILHIDRNIFLTTCLGDSVFCLEFIGSLCQKIRILESYISQEQKDLQMRCIEFLLSNEYRLHSLTQKTIAQLLNVAPESLSRILKRLKTNGLIKTHKGKIILLKPESLRRFLQ